MQISLSSFILQREESERPLQTSGKRTSGGSTGRRECEELSWTKRKRCEPPCSFTAIELPERAVCGTTCTATVFFEIYYVVCGELQYLVEGNHYIPRQNSVLLIPRRALPRSPHRQRRPLWRYALHFSSGAAFPEYRETLLIPFRPGGLFLEDPGTGFSGPVCLPCWQAERFRSR